MVGLRNCGISRPVEYLGLLRALMALLNDVKRLSIGHVQFYAQALAGIYNGCRLYGGDE